MLFCSLKTYKDSQHHIIFRSLPSPELSRINRFKPRIAVSCVLLKSPSALLSNKAEPQPFAHREREGKRRRDRTFPWEQLHQITNQKDCDTGHSLFLFSIKWVILVVPETWKKQRSQVAYGGRKALDVSITSFLSNMPSSGSFWRFLILCCLWFSIILFVWFKTENGIWWSG